MYPQLLLKASRMKNQGMSFVLFLPVGRRNMLMDRLYRFMEQPPARDQLLLTKGDNNPVDDIDLYKGISWLERRHIVGKVRGSVSSSYSHPDEDYANCDTFSGSYHTLDTSPLPW